MRNLDLIKITNYLKKKTRELDAPIWGELAERLERSKNKLCAVNISRINRYTENGDTVTIPGKVLGSGILDHKVSVAAFSFSKGAKQRIESVGGECIPLFKIVDKNPNGKNLKIIE